MAFTDTAARRLAATALAGGLAAAALFGAGAGSAGAYNQHPKGCPDKSYPNVGSISASLKIHSTHPHPGNDPIRVTATSGGKPISGGRVHYLFIWNNQIVSCQPVAPPEVPYFKHGVFRDVLKFPAAAVAAKPFLVVRVVIEWHGLRKNLDVDVVVQK